MREPAAKRMDDISESLAEVLRQADAMLEEWSRFGASVRAQVEREATQIGRAVADGTGVAVERAVATQLASLSKELQLLEQRVRSTSRAVAEQRTNDRRLLGGIAAGLAIAIILLVVLVARGPAAPQVIAPVPASAGAPLPPADAAAPIDAPVIHVDAAVPAPPADAGKPPVRRR